MKLFGGTTPQEKAISTLIHDHVNALAKLDIRIKLIEIGFGNNDMELVKKYIPLLMDAKQKIQLVLDNYLNKAKTDFI